MRIAIISNITWLTLSLNFYNFIIYFFFYNLIVNSILLEHFKLSSKTYKTKTPSFSTRPKKNTQYTVLRNSFTIDTRSIPIHIQNIIHPFKPGL